MGLACVPEPQGSQFQFRRLHEMGWQDDTHWLQNTRYKQHAFLPVLLGGQLDVKSLPALQAMLRI